MKLSIRGFSLACGITLGLAVFVLTAWFLIFGYQASLLGKLSNLYLGYSVSWGGAFIGLLWGFADGLIGGAVFAWLYNKFAGSSR